MIIQNKKIIEVYLINTIVKVRASVFIPMSWTETKKDTQTGIENAVKVSSTL